MRNVVAFKSKMIGNTCKTFRLGVHTVMLRQIMVTDNEEEGIQIWQEIKKSADYNRDIA